MTLDPTLALVDQLRRLPRAMRAALYDSFDIGALHTRHYDFGFWGRPDQQPPPREDDSWGILVFRGPRGSGKTESAVAYFVGEIYAGAAEYPCIVVGTGKNDARVIASRIQKSVPPRLRPTWNPAGGAAGVLTFPGPSGPVEVPVYSAAAPEGVVMNNFDLVFCDDIAKWGPHAETAWNHVRLTCRVGYARIVVATTKRGTLLLEKLLAGKMTGVVVRRPADPQANRNNLHARFFKGTAADLRGTAFGADEVDDEDRDPNSPFAGLDFDKAPIRVFEAGEMVESVVIVDPADGKGPSHDEWGIGAAGRRRDRHVVALEDNSGSYDEAEAGNKVLDLCERRGITRIVVETNRGPRVLSALRAAHYRRELDRLAADPKALPRPLPELIPVNAMEGKKLRASPLRTLYLDGMLHHMPGLDGLERQQREWDPDAPKRPRVDDRIDWLVHACHHLADLAAKHLVTPEEAYDGFAEAQARMPARGWFEAPQGATRAPRSREV